MSDVFRASLDEFYFCSDINFCVDAIGLRCPMPLIKMKQALQCLAVGDLLILRATDADSVKDISSFTSLTSHQLVDHQKIQQVYVYIIRKGF